MVSYIEFRHQNYAEYFSRRYPVSGVTRHLAYKLLLVNVIKILSCYTRIINVTKSSEICIRLL